MVAVNDLVDQSRWRCRWRSRSRRLSRPRSASSGAAALRVIGGRCWASLVVCGCVLGLAPAARAEPDPGDAVALLPLDADRNLEIYGQPVASELARALVAGSVPVVVVGPRMAVPQRARLIVDGTIALGKASTVTISLRIRNTLDGTVLDTLSATAPGLAKIDGAAADLSARIVPIVHDKLARLAALHRQPGPGPGSAPASEDHGRVVQTPAVPLADRVVLVALADSTAAGRGAPLLLRALDAELAEWTRVHHRGSRKLEAAKLEPAVAARTVAAGGAELAIGLWILDYAPEAGAVPIARARVRVRIAGASAVVFDRVVVTDSVIGEPRSAAPELAARVARELLAILRPHMRRSVPSWE